MEQKVLMKKKGIEYWKEFKDRRFLGWRKTKTKQQFLSTKGMGIWHKGQKILFKREMEAKV